MHARKLENPSITDATGADWAEKVLRACFADEMLPDLGRDPSPRRMEVYATAAKKIAEGMVGAELNKFEFFCRLARLMPPLSVGDDPDAIW